MRINLAIVWDEAPSAGRIELTGGKLFRGGILRGTGSYDDGSFTFSDRGLCHMTFAVDAEETDSGELPTTISIADTERPFSFALSDVLRTGEMLIRECGVTVTAERDAWESLAGEPTGKESGTMELPLYREFTEDQIEKFGPVREREVISTTERRVYTSPFMYTNVKAGDFYEIDPDKGIEFKADDGFLTIEEGEPIVAVTVVGSGCTPGGYNICEWWDDGENIDNLKNQLVKRQRIDNLNGTHPSIWSLLLLGRCPGLTFRDVSQGDIKGPADCLKKLSERYYGEYSLGFYENTAYFRVGPPYPRKVTIRCGCKGTEDPGTSIERYPADYAVRVVETLVMKT